MSDTNQHTSLHSVSTPNESEKQQHHLGCGILGRFPVISIVAFAAAGIATGVGLSMWMPDTEAQLSQKQTALQWIGLIGDLFIRALKCVVQVRATRY